MYKKRVIPHHQHMFLSRQGLKIMPSQNFLDKFKEIYNDLLHNDKSKQNIKPLDDKTAIFFINSLIEAVIYCIDFGYDVWFRRTLLFLQKTCDYRLNSKTAKKSVVENIKKLTVKPIISKYLKIKKIINQDNEKYQEFIQKKAENFNKIKRYYRDFYDKKDEWWQGLPD